MNIDDMNSKKQKYYEIKSWEDKDLNLSAGLLRGIYSHGFEDPSPIQKSVVYTMGKYTNKEGKYCDILAQAQSGTGKTGAFTISTLCRYENFNDKDKILVIAPTHELARQISNEYKALGQYLKIKVALLIGGTPVDNDRRFLEKNNPPVIVGTPGRIQDIIRRKYLKPDDIKVLVIDEVDEMLSQGFRAQMYEILSIMNENIQIGLFSATLPPQVLEITNGFLHEPAKILVKTEQLTLQGIEQCFLNVSDDTNKFENIKKLFSVISLNQTLIYCNSVRRVDELHEAMICDGFPVNKIHGKLTTNEREEISKKFKNGEFRILICTDMYARGIDVQQVSLVINFDIPKNVSTYLHRIGRSGRWGRKGKAINFQTRYDIYKIKHLEQYYDTQIKELPSNWAEYLD